MCIALPLLRLLLFIGGNGVYDSLSQAIDAIQRLSRVFKQFGIMLACEQIGLAVGDNRLEAFQSRTVSCQLLYGVLKSGGIERHEHEYHGVVEPGGRAAQAAGGRR